MAKRKRKGRDEYSAPEEQVPDVVSFGGDMPRADSRIVAFFVSGCMLILILVAASFCGFFWMISDTREIVTKIDDNLPKGQLTDEDIDRIESVIVLAGVIDERQATLRFRFLTVSAGLLSGVALISLGGLVLCLLATESSKARTATAQLLMAGRHSTPGILLAVAGALLIGVTITSVRLDLDSPIAPREIRAKYIGAGSEDEITAMKETIQELQSKLQDLTKSNADDNGTGASGGQPIAPDSPSD